MMSDYRNKYYILLDVIRCYSMNIMFKKSFSWQFITFNFLYVIS